MSDKTFEPRIVGFLCNWCTYTVADSAGVARMEQPPNVDVIRVMCTGRIEPMFVLKAFAEGADGIMAASASSALSAAIAPTAFLVCSMAAMASLSRDLLASSSDSFR